MKTEEITAASVVSAGWRRGQLRCYGHPGSNPLLALYDNPISRLYSLINDRKPLALCPEADTPLLDFILLPHDEHIGTGLVDRDRRLRDHHDLVAALLFDDHAHGLSVGQHAVRVGKHRTDDLTIGSRVDLDVEKIDPPALVIERAVSQPHTSPHLAVRARIAPRLEHLALRDGKEHLHRVLLDDCRQHASVRPDEIAGRRGCSSDPAADGC